MNGWITNVRILPALTEGFSLTSTNNPLEPWTACHIEVTEGKLTGIAPADNPPAEDKAILWDGENRLFLPGLVDVHVHLDKAHTWGRAPNISGSFAEAIQVLSDDKVHWTAEDLHKRASYSLRTAEAQGTTAIRTHLDTDPDRARVAYEVMRDLANEWKDKITLQYVSLCGVDEYATAKGEAIADLVAETGGSALGGMPLMNPDLDQQIDRMLDIASERGLPIDLHVDESGDPEARTLLAVAKGVLRKQFSLPVNCGHCCSLSILPPAIQAETLQAVAAAGIRVISLPLCNQYLQGRTLLPSQKPGTPQWRGLTLLHELHEEGVKIAAASDNVRDAFYAFGDFDMLEVLQTTLRHGHFDLRPELALKMVSSHPADMMDLPTVGRLIRGAPLNGVLCEARSLSELFSRPERNRAVIRSGQKLKLDLPPYSDLD